MGIGPNPQKIINLKNKLYKINKIKNIVINYLLLNLSYN